MFENAHNAVNAHESTPTWHCCSARHGVVLRAAGVGSRHPSVRSVACSRCAQCEAANSFENDLTSGGSSKDDIQGDRLRLGSRLPKQLGGSGSESNSTGNV